MFGLALSSLLSATGTNNKQEAIPKSLSRFLNAAPLSLLLLGCAIVQLSTPLAVAQSSTVAPQVGASSRPVSLAHCYWHFLMYQNHLDSLATLQEAQGKDGGWLRGHLQTKLGLADTDFASIRVSSLRLSAKVKALDANAVRITAAGNTSTTHQQLSALTLEREASINAEILSLQQTLGPQKTAAFEAFITEMFSPKSVAIRLQPSPVQAVPTAVQR